MKMNYIVNQSESYGFKTFAALRVVIMTFGILVSVRIPYNVFITYVKHFY